MKKLIILPGCKGQVLAEFKRRLIQTYNQIQPKCLNQQKAVKGLEFCFKKHKFDSMCSFLKTGQNPRTSIDLSS